MNIKIVIFLIIGCFGNNVLLGQELDSIDLKLEQHALETPRSVERSLETLVPYLSEAATTEAEIVAVFFYWIAAHIEYDTALFLKGKVLYGNEDPLKTRKAICQGYSELLQRMCDVAGIECYLVDGFAKVNGNDPKDLLKESNHAWNVVKVEGEYLYIDATWGSGYVQYKLDKLNYHKKIDLSQVLTRDSVFYAEHLAADPKWQLREQLVSLEEFVYEQPIVKKPIYHYLDSIAVYVQSDRNRQAILDARNRFEFHSTEYNRMTLAKHYYNIGVKLSTHEPSKRELRQAIWHYEQAIHFLTPLKNRESRRIQKSAREGIAYARYYLK